MTRFLLFSLLISLASTEIREVPRLRALWNFEEVTECVLHYRALVYNNYGCWCGIGGSHEPVDGIDACCREHDHCYDKAIEEHKCFDVPQEYVDNYNWKCQNSTAICGNGQSPCQEALCACDTTVVKCWSQYPKPTSKPKCNRSFFQELTKWFTA